MKVRKQTSQVQARSGRRMGNFPMLGFSLSFALSLSACGATSPEMQHSHVLHEDLVDADIPPDWVIEGSPKARIKHVANAPGGVMNPAIWECSAGKFNWHFASDELVHILGGEVLVRSDDGSERVLKPGDVAYFPAGMHSVWEVNTFVRKLAVFAENSAPLSLRVQRKLGKLFGSD